jgi:hypothetical protein
MASQDSSERFYNRHKYDIPRLMVEPMGGKKAKTYFVVIDLTNGFSDGPSKIAVADDSRHKYMYRFKSPGYRHILL